MSGITCTDECVDAYNKFKLQNGPGEKDKHAYIIYRIDGEKIVIDKLGPVSATWDQFVEEITSKPKDGCYGIYDFTTETKEGRKLQKIVFVVLVLYSVPVKSKMLYGWIRDAIKQALGSGLAVTIQASDLSDLDFEAVEQAVIKGR